MPLGEAVGAGDRGARVIAFSPFDGWIIRPRVGRRVLVLGQRWAGKHHHARDEDVSFSGFAYCKVPQGHCANQILVSFGWIKTIGGLARPKFKGLARQGFGFTFAMAAYNLVRLLNLIAGRRLRASTSGSSARFALSPRHDRMPSRATISTAC